MDCAADLYQLIVACPVRGNSALEECTACPYFKGFSLDPTGRDSFTTCAFPGPPLPVPAPAAEPLSHAHVPVTALMKDPICVRPDLLVTRLGDLFTEAGISGAPVVDDDARPIGFVSKTDIVRDGAASTAVSTIMSREVHALTERSSLADAAELMARKRIHRIAITSVETGRVTGILSALDVTRWVAQTKTPRGTGTGGYQLRP